MIGRDISALLETGRCTICGEDAPKKNVVPWVEAHAKKHLAEGSAVTISEHPPHGGRRTTRVVPVSSLPDEVERPKVAAHPRTPRIPKGFKGVFQP